MKKLLLSLALLFFGFSVAHAAVTTPANGGTGISTTTAGNVGNCLKVSSSSPFLVYAIAGCGSGTSTISGTGTSTDITFWTGANTLGADDSLTYDTSTFILGINGLQYSGTGISNGTEGYYFAGIKPLIIGPNNAQLELDSSGEILLSPSTSNGTLLQDPGSFDIASFDTSLLGSNSNYQFPDLASVGGTDIFCTKNLANCSSGGTGGISGSGTSTYVTVWNGTTSTTGYANFVFDGTKLTIQAGGTSSVPLILTDGSSTNQAQLNTSQLTGSHAYKFPDASGIFCLTTTCLTAFSVTSTNAFISVASNATSASLTFSSSSLNLNTFLSTTTAAATYYPLTNPTGFVTSSITIATATASGVWNVTSSGNKAFTITLPSNVGFFTNDKGYVTSTGLTNASITAISPILWSTTSSILCPTCVTHTNALTTNYFTIGGSGGNIQGVGDLNEPAAGQIQYDSTAIIDGFNGVAGTYLQGVSTTASIVGGQLTIANTSTFKGNISTTIATGFVYSNNGLLTMTSTPSGGSGGVATSGTPLAGQFAFFNPNGTTITGAAGLTINTTTNIAQVNPSLAFARTSAGSSSQTLVTQDANDFLTFQSSGGTQGSGVNPYTLFNVEAPTLSGNCTSTASSVSNSQESTISLSHVLPVGVGENYLDITDQCYPGGSFPDVESVIRETAIGSSTITPFALEFTYAPGFGSAALANVYKYFVATPVNSQSSTQGITLAINSQTSTFSNNVQVSGFLLDLNGNKYVTSTGLVSYNVISANGALSVSTTTTSATLTVNTSTILSGYATSTNISPGSCTNCNVTFNANGLATTFSNGSGGTGGNGTITAATSTYIAVYSASTTVYGTSTFTYTAPTTATATAAFVLGQASSTACEKFRNASDTGFIYSWFNAVQGMVLSLSTTTFCNP